MWVGKLVTIVATALAQLGQPGVPIAMARFFLAAPKQPLRHALLRPRADQFFHRFVAHGISKFQTHTALEIPAYRKGMISESDDLGYLVRNTEMLSRKAPARLSQVFSEKCTGLWTIIKT